MTGRIEKAHRCRTGSTFGRRRCAFLPCAGWFAHCVLNRCDKSSWKLQLDAFECAAGGSSDKAREGRRSGPCHLSWHMRRRRHATRQSCNRACSALTQWVMSAEGEIVNVHNDFPRPTSGQLRFSGSLIAILPVGHASVRVPKRSMRSDRALPWRRVRKIGFHHLLTVSVCLMG